MEMAEVPISTTRPLQRLQDDHPPQLLLRSVQQGEVLLRALYFSADVLLVPLVLLSQRWPTSWCVYLLQGYVLPLIGIQLFLYVGMVITGPSSIWFGHPFVMFGSTTNYDNPSASGLPHARHVHIRTSDGEILGGWHVLPGGATARAAASQVAAGSDTEQVFDAALREAESTPLPAARAVIYLHGLGESRCKWVVVEHLKLISSLLGMHALAIDYRGFADSTGAPTELGFISDAAAALAWLKERGVRPDEVMLWGHSLGTGVAVRLAHAQQQKGAPLHSVVLESAYSSLRLASMNYPAVMIFRALPFGRPLVWRNFRAGADELDTLARITELGCPVLLLHGAADSMVPMRQHSQDLARKLREGGFCHMFVPFSSAGHVDVVLHPALLATLVDFLDVAARESGRKSPPPSDQLGDQLGDQRARRALSW